MKAINNENYDNNYLTIEANEYILNELGNLFGNKILLTKQELADVLNLTIWTISNKISNKALKIRHVKTADSTSKFCIVSYNCCC